MGPVHETHIILLDPKRALALAGRPWEGIHWLCSRPSAAESILLDARHHRDGRTRSAASPRFVRVRGLYILPRGLLPRAEGDRPTCGECFQAVPGSPRQQAVQALVAQLCSWDGALSSGAPFP